MTRRAASLIDTEMLIQNEGNTSLVVFGAEWLRGNSKPSDFQDIAKLVFAHRIQPDQDRGVPAILVGHEERQRIGGDPSVALVVAALHDENSVLVAETREDNAAHEKPQCSVARAFDGAREAQRQASRRDDGHSRPSQGFRSLHDGDNGR
jgi:hypothetical protein